MLFLQAYWFILHINMSQQARNHKTSVAQEMMTVQVGNYKNDFDYTNFKPIMKERVFCWQKYNNIMLFMPLSSESFATITMTVFRESLWNYFRNFIQDSDYKIWHSELVKNPQPQLYATYCLSRDPKLWYFFKKLTLKGSQSYDISSGMLH